MNPDRPILFIAADRREAEPWIARWENTRAPGLPVHWARAGKWRGRPMIAIANGVGGERAIAAVQAARSISEGFTAVWSIGTGGALDPELQIAEVVAATAVTDGTLIWPATDATGPSGPAVRRGMVYSSRHIARTAEEKTNLHKSGAIIVEMESAGVAAMAQDLGAPFYCVRVVSDLAGETFFTDFEDFLTVEGRFSAPRLALHAMRNPVKGLGELLRLQKRTSLAAEKLAEFLASCQF
jgi:adenosylhomocysteine nucleosidase